MRWSRSSCCPFPARRGINEENAGAGSVPSLPEEGLWLFAGKRTQNPVSVWIPCVFTSRGIAADAPIENRRLQEPPILINCRMTLDEVIAQVESKFSWQLAVLMASHQQALRFRRLGYKLLPRSEVTDFFGEGEKKNAMTFMHTLTVEEDVILSEGTLLRQSEARQKEAKFRQQEGMEAVADLIGLQRLPAAVAGRQESKPAGTKKKPGGPASSSGSTAASSGISGTGGGIG